MSVVFAWLLENITYVQFSETSGAWNNSIYFELRYIAQDLTDF